MDLQKVVEEMHKLNTRVGKVLDILVGSDVDKSDKGLVGRVNSQEDRITKLEKLVYAGKWILVGMALPSSFGVASIIGYLIDHFYKK